MTENHFHQARLSSSRERKVSTAGIKNEASILFKSGGLRYEKPFRFRQAVTGRYTLTGFNGTVRTGEFSFTSAPRSDAIMGRDWDVLGRTGKPLIGPITDLRGQIGVTDGGFPVGVAYLDSIYRGDIDGIDFRLGCLGQTNTCTLSSLNAPLSVPEPGSFALLLFQALGLTMCHRRQASHDFYKKRGPLAKLFQEENNFNPFLVSECLEGALNVHFCRTLG